MFLCYILKQRACYLLYVCLKESLKVVPAFNLQYSFLAHYHEQLLTQTSSTALATLNMVSPNNWAKNRSLKKERVRNGLTSLRWWCMSNLTFRETGAGHSKKHFVWLTKVKVRRLACKVCNYCTTSISWSTGFWQIQWVHWSIQTALSTKQSYHILHPTIQKCNYLQYLN